MKRNMVLLNVILVMTFPLALNATTIGSDTAVTLISTMTTLNNGDIVTGFTSLQGGFFIADSTVTATWNALFPVSGSALFNGGALYLQRSLDFTDNTLLSMPGTIIGNGYSMDIAPTITSFADGCFPTLRAATNTVNITSDATVGGGWSYDERFVAITGDSSSNQFVETYRFDGVKLAFAGSISGPFLGIPGTCKWSPSAYYVATAGAPADLYLFSVDSQTGALTQLDSADAGGNAVYDLAWHPTGAYIAVANSTNTNTILALFPVSSGSLGTPTFITSSNFQATGCDWMVTGTYLGVATSIPANMIEIYALGSGPTLNLLLSHSVSYQPGYIKWNPVYQNIFAVTSTNAASNFALAYIYQYDVVANTITELTNTGAKGFTVQSGNAINWSNDGSCLLFGLEVDNNFDNGMYVYSYNATTTTLEFVVKNNSNATEFNESVCSYSPINNYILQILTFSQSSDLPSPLQVYVPNVINLYNLTTAFHNDFNLDSYSLVAHGDCSILGDGFTLALKPGAFNLSIAANSTLTLKNLHLTNVGVNTIQMADSSSTLILDNVTIALDGAPTFTQGTLEVAKNVEFIGQGTFVYSSTMPCIVDAQTTLLFDNDTTFSFVPASSARNLLQFTDSSSHLFLNGASLVTTRTGINLTKGTLVIDRHTTIASDATVAAEGIAFGDGVSAANNMNVQIYPAATLEVTKGIVVDNNV